MYDEMPVHRQEKPRNLSLK